MSYAFRITQCPLICSDPIPTALAPRLLQIQSPRKRHTTAYQQYYLRLAGTSYLPVVTCYKDWQHTFLPQTHRPHNVHTKSSLMRSCRPAHEELVVSHSETVPAIYQLDSQHTCRHVTIRQAAIQPSYSQERAPTCCRNAVKYLSISSAAA